MTAAPDPRAPDAARGEVIAESGWWSDKSIAEIIHEYAVVRGDLVEQYARDQLEAIIVQRIARAATGGIMLGADHQPDAPTREGVSEKLDRRALLADRAAFAARLAEVEGEVERLRGEHLAFTRALGFGDGVTEPAATLAQMVDPIEQAFSEASEYLEGPRICEPCGEWLATQVCEHCHGSGCGPGTALGAYEECEWCAGVGKVHPGCVERSYADLVAERDDLDTAIGTLLGEVVEWRDMAKRLLAGGDA
jgi:hypothetical protein